MTTCGRLANSAPCTIMFCPPITNAIRTPTAAPNTPNCSLIWMANSRVGVRTMANTP